MPPPPEPFEEDAPPNCPDEHLPQPAEEMFNCVKSKMWTCHRLCVTAVVIVMESLGACFRKEPVLGA
ncbi:hypothetical protein JTE90_026416 [Oedothorax gibbosus]|uniref:Uncharacterized protein n=1 Tax=Oedothorax gibbosus TaxID=931172 RepID=A0AAV6TH28_9ARAC|nr:hypothetical protein JTE90_026416 [Oedothorax gibbosus]